MQLPEYDAESGICVSYRFKVSIIVESESIRTFLNLARCFPSRTVRFYYQ